MWAEPVTGGPERRSAGTAPPRVPQRHPSAAVVYPPMVRAAASAGLSFITWSRPGYATSTPQPGRSVADVIADKAALTGEFAEFTASVNHRALSTGITGWRDDVLASVHNWGFDPGENTRPVMVWHGEQDRMVPFSHGRWLSEHVPGAIPRLLPDQGHLSLAVEHVGEIVQDLRAFAGV